MSPVAVGWVRVSRCRPQAEGRRNPLSQFRLALIALSGLTLAGCLFDKASDDPNAWYNKTMAEHITGRSAASADAAATTTVVAAPRPPVPESELYRSDASCGGLAPGGRAVAVADVTLDMTECEVARRVGAPEKVDLSANERGERVLLLTYTRGEHPRVYRFAGGRLAGFEALAPGPRGRERLAKPAAPPTSPR